MIDAGNQENKDTRVRVRFLLALFLILGFVILVKLFSWQVIRAEELQSLASSQHKTSFSIPARRGSILASDGFPLAASQEAWLVWASLKDLEGAPQDIAGKLAPVLADEPREETVEATSSGEEKELEPPKTKDELTDEERKRLLTLLTKDASWVPLKHKITSEEKEQIEKLEINGLGFDFEEDRSYPEASMSAHLLGFVGKDTAGQDKGYFGLEGYYDLMLSGVSGELSREKDARGLPLLIGTARRVAPRDGMTLKTHIDRSIQFLVEKKLAEGIEKYGAKRGSVVIMRPEDGAVLAMANFPSYSPEEFEKFSQDRFLNPIAGSSFEPGSIFKVLVMSAALDAGVVKPDTKCEACTGPRRVAEYTIGTWDGKYYPESTMAEVIEHSDNVGMIWVAEQLGKEKFYEYLVKFGIGKSTGVDLQGEQTPSLRPKNEWSFVDLTVAAFGQGVAVTPLQMVRSVAAIANGGVLPAPQVVDEVQGDGWDENIAPGFEGRVISKKTAEQMTQMMVNAVEAGEAKWAKLPGFRIAGKTGTAQIPVAGHYDDEKTIASFVGFAPAQNPKFVMLVTLREPESSPWASETAAPLWFSIAKDLFPYLGIQPE